MKLDVITGINRMTGERENVSAPRSYYRSQKLMQQWQTRMENCQEPAWTDLKVKKFACENPDRPLKAYNNKNKHGKRT